MSTYIRVAQPVEAPVSGLKGTVLRHRIASYFVLMFAGLWLAYLPLLLSSHAFGVLPVEFPFPVVLFNLPASLLGPLLAGAVISSIVSGKEGRREFFGRIFRVKVPVKWYLIPLAAIPVLGVASLAAVQGGAPVATFVASAGAFIAPYLIGAILLPLIVNLWEESGQMAFVTPELQRRHGAVVTSVIVAATWALMHLPSLFVPEMGVGVGGPLSVEGIALGMLILTAYAIPVRIVATWLFNSARESVVIVAIFHGAMNSAQGELQRLLPGYNPFYLIGAFAVVSFVLIAVTRGRLGSKEQEAPQSYRQGEVEPHAVPVVQA